MAFFLPILHPIMVNLYLIVTTVPLHRYSSAIQVHVRIQVFGFSKNADRFSEGGENYETGLTMEKLLRWGHHFNIDLKMDPILQCE